MGIRTWSDATGISHTDVFNNLNNLFIINYWPAAHYLDPGHIPGAMQYTPKESLKSTKDLLTLRPTNKLSFIATQVKQVLM
jgi:hypothetical protein